jgi:hypothetical protein
MKFPLHCYYTKNMCVHVLGGLMWCVQQAARVLGGGIFITIIHTKRTENTISLTQELGY